MYQVGVQEKDPAQRAKNRPVEKYQCFWPALHNFSNRQDNINLKGHRYICCNVDLGQANLYKYSLR